MPLPISWAIDQHVILITSVGDSTDQDFFALDQPCADLIEASPAEQVHVIIDCSGSPYTPSGKAITQIRFPKNPRIGWVILVGSVNVLQRFGFAIGSTFFKIQAKQANTVAEALEFLNNADHTLPDVKVERVS